MLELTLYRPAVQRIDLLDDGGVIDVSTVLSDAGDEPPAGAVLVNIGEVRAALLKIVEKRKFRVSDSKKTKGTVVSTAILVHAINRLFMEVQDGKR